MQYAKSAEQAPVEDIIFRGSNLEIRVRLNLISAVRSINDSPLEIGETVDVFIYRMFVIEDDKIRLAQNLAIQEENVVI